MMVLFHFIFELIKISILGCIYATLTLIIFLIIGRFKPNSWFNRVSRKKMRLWFLSGLCASVALFLFMFTYWGDHGLGDSARIPIGHFKDVQETDGTRAYIQNTGYDHGNLIEVKEFAFNSDYLSGITGVNPVYKYPGEYFVWNIKSNEVNFFKNKNEYEKYALQNQLPLSDEFADFFYHYKKYWNGWRFWIIA